MNGHRSKKNKQKKQQIGHFPIPATFLISQSAILLYI